MKKLNRSFTSIVAVAGLAVLLVSPGADASYGGTITRTVAGSVLIPLSADRTYWSNQANSAEVTDTSSSTTFHFANYSMPVDSPTTNGTVTYSAYMGGGNSGISQVQVQGLVYSTTGGLLASTTVSETSGSIPSASEFTLSPAESLGAGDQTVFSVAAQNGGIIYWLAQKSSVTSS